MTLDIDITARQLAFVRAKAFEVLFGGAAGGGKSYGQLIDALLYALRYPGSKQLILRRTYPDLERSLILE
ncbi:Terminase-like family protein, partial [Anaerofilum sp. BX8]|nr:Terminase-like family protein [Anaerofilum hominis]MBC5581947.1 Terminase-like family protein [Anaerofilum hominis]